MNESTTTILRKGYAALLMRPMRLVTRMLAAVEEGTRGRKAMVFV